MVNILENAPHTPREDNSGKPEELWVTKGGTAVTVSEMSVHHARNTLRMLIRLIRTGNIQAIGDHQARINEARDFYNIKED